MNTETVTVQPKGEGFEIIVQHDQTGSAYGIDLSKDAYEQLRLHFVGSSAMPEGFRVYECTDCQEVNVKKDNRKVRVGFCDACDHPLWNSVEDVPHD
jgi:hypothetical protein